MRGRGGKHLKHLQGMKKAVENINQDSNFFSLPMFQLSNLFKHEDRVKRQVPTYRKTLQVSFNGPTTLLAS